MKRIKYLIILLVFLFPLSVKGYTELPVDLTNLTIIDIQDYVDKGVFSYEDLVRVYIDRIEEYDDEYNSILSLNEEAINIAKKLDKEREENGIRSLVHGIPILVKDNIDYAGMATTGGTKALSDSIPNTNAKAISYLVDKGAIILGKTNMSELALSVQNSYSSYGYVRNAYNKSYTSYGSSGGSAVSTSLMFSVASLGTDTNSSVRIPSASAGLVGIRPTYGLVSNEGVIKYDFQTGESIHYTVKDGMPSNVVFRILRDNDRCFWISTANGLVRFDSKTEQITTFTENHGLISRQFNENSAFKDSDENFYFGSVKGFVHFRPEDVRMDVRHAKVYLHTLELDNGKRVINIPSESSGQKIELGHEESTFSINFSTLDFIAPASVKYAYRLNGSNQSWIEIGGRNTVYFANLSPGDYVFEVKATDFSNHWSDEVTSLNIAILPAWWQSTFARFMFVIIIFVMIISFIYRWKAKAKREMAYNMQLFEDKKEKELYQSKIDFFINIAHEIRTPLTLIKNPLEKIIMSNVIQGKESESLRLMNRNVTRLMSLVNQLLDFRKTETDGYKLSFVRTDMIALLKENVKFFRESAAENNLLLNIDCTMDELYAYVDREAVTKIFSNLLLNAIKYAQHSIVIRVSMNEEYDSFSIDFINDGKPVPPELREKIFEPFYRVEVNTEGKTGTGLGLPFARSLAEMHNGSLTLETYAANEGLTMFRLVLPLHLPESIHTEENSSLSGEAELSLRFEEGRPAVLVVEDNGEMRKFVAEEVNTLYNVYVAENGKVATEILGKESVQLVISDVMMPVMDGLELLHFIKSNEEYTHIPVILLTAKTTARSHLEGLEHGADAYIDKPFFMPLLMAQISNLISNRDNIRKFYFKSPIANMKSIAYSKTDEKFLDKLNTIINDNMRNPDFDVNMLAEMMNISRPTLYRKVRSISDLTPNDLIKMARLKKSAELLLAGEMKIYEIAEAVGFSSQSYFWSAFIKEFGVSPSKYVKDNMGKE